MGIDGINDYGSRMAGGRIPAIPSVSPEEVRRQDEEKRAQEFTAAAALQETDLEIRSDAPLEEITAEFNAKGDYDRIGSDADIGRLDMEKAISDMKKDSVLHQYQFFVGSSKNLYKETADGIVIPKL